MSETRVLNDEISGRIAWRGEDLAPDDGHLIFTPGCLAELDALVREISQNPLPLPALRPDDFELPESRALMQQAREVLEEGVGFVLIDRLPMDRWSREQAKAAYWLLCSMVERPVAQKWDGTMIYDVRDTGKKPGNGVRPDITNVEQNFHSDNSYNLCPPWYVSLLCLQTAKEGGISGLISFYEAHNEMRKRHPDLLPRLYENYIFDRQREHAPDDVKILRHPMFEYDGQRLNARLSRFQVINGQKLAGEELDSRGRAALGRLRRSCAIRRWLRNSSLSPDKFKLSIIAVAAIVGRALSIGLSRTGTVILFAYGYAGLGDRSTTGSLPVYKLESCIGICHKVPPMRNRLGFEPCFRTRLWSWRCPRAAFSAKLCR